ncbi:SRPBCC family protein [Archangium violaceum]|uniref:SRPBCC family protein n=1 Tax=Archangium violaceum TaxID=83451 RepID=UPI00193C7DE4|nr:SRPBCC family protein [Archangium violaceum]QRK09494.1 SRPBCC family protein [Archangium violaceum]
MLKKILIAFATLMALVLAIGLALPSKYRVERSTSIPASSEAVYAHVASLKRWEEWVPWNATRFPGNQWVIGGPEVGVGAVRSWSGEDVGNGTLSLTEADPKTGVVYEMSVEHGEYLVHGRISFSPEDSGTRVTWVDEGEIGGNPFAHYLVPLIESRLGGHIEEALANLQKQVEAHPLPAQPEPEPEPEPAPVVQAPEPSPPSAFEPPAPVSGAEGSPGVIPPVEGTGGVVPAPLVEGSQGSAPVEVPPTTPTTTPPMGEPAPASPVVVAPSGEAAPPQAAPVAEPAPAPTPASAQIPPPASAPGGASSTLTPP